MSEPLIIPIAEAAAHEGITREYAYEKWKVLSTKLPNGNLGISVACLSEKGRNSWFESKLITPEPSATPDQPSFWPILDTDKQAVAGLSKADQEQIFYRLKFVAASNHDYAAAGYRIKTEFDKMLAKQANVSIRTLRDWRKRRREQGLIGLADRPRGPAKGTGAVLEQWEQDTLTLDYRNGLTIAQCFRNHQQRVEAKRTSPGCRASIRYGDPTYQTDRRFLQSLDFIFQSARQGPDARNAACGYIDRSYLDLKPMERVESDEVKLNLFSYDERRKVNRDGKPWIRRYWLLSFYDARSMFPLVWTLCEGSEYELRHGIALDDELNLFVKLVREFGVPNSIHSDRGRFRGREWGGEPYQQKIDKAFAPMNGILQRVGILAGLPDGIRHEMPRVHNPRGTRLERFHRWVADWFRGKPGWIGANTRERKMTEGDAESDRHKLWCVGKLAPGEPSPLWSRERIATEVDRMMEAWRDHNSEGTDMN